jgi:hypothetical protein
MLFILDFVSDGALAALLSSPTAACQHNTMTVLPRECCSPQVTKGHCCHHVAAAAVRSSSSLPAALHLPCACDRHTTPHHTMMARTGAQHATYSSQSTVARKASCTGCRRQGQHAVPAGEKLNRMDTAISTAAAINHSCGRKY